MSLLARAEYRGARLLTGLSPKLQAKLGAPVEADGDVLHPELQVLLAARELLGVEDRPEDPGVRRERMRRDAMAYAGPPPAVGAVRELELPLEDGPLRARHYAPGDPGGPHPLLVFFHGGGMVVGDLDTHDLPCRLLCRHAGVHVLSVDYRLAPEHRFPAAAEDAVAVTTWAVANAATLGADPARVAVGGDSAGGNLSAVAAQHVDGLAAQVLVYPATDRVTAYPSLDAFAEGLFLTKEEIGWYHDTYTGSPDVPRDDPRLSPIYGELGGLAPAIVVTAAFDPLRDEGEAYGRALQEAGTPAIVRRAPGLVHGYINMGGVSPACRDATVELAGMLRGLLALAR